MATRAARWLAGHGGPTGPLPHEPSAGAQRLCIGPTSELVVAPSGTILKEESQ
jgi:hypothetical protein